MPFKLFARARKHVTEWSYMSMTHSVRSPASAYANGESEW
jgi:hypothetical protein